MTVSEEFLRQKYQVEQLSLREVAAQAGVGAGTIRYHMRRYGIPRRTKSEALSGDKNPMHGRQHTEAARQKIADTLGKTNLKVEVRTRRKAASAGEKNPMFGRSHSDESRQVMSEKQRALFTPERRSAASLRMKEVMNRPEVRAALSEKAQLRVGNQNPFFGRKHTKETKATLSKANQNRFRGPKGSNWKGGLTPLYLQIRNCSKMEAWRKDIFVRDNFTCVLCSKRGGKLNADHINPFARILHGAKVTTLEEAETLPELWDLANGRTLCVPCHRKTDTFAGRTRVV